MFHTIIVSDKGKNIGTIIITIIITILAVTSKTSLYVLLMKLEGSNGI